MQLTLNHIYSGFLVKEVQYIEDVGSQAYLMEHCQSGAQLFYLANEDENKVFSISFRTPPSNDKGIPHILEHSVLCGSRKYPLKEPFVDLVKGSLNTFLNAMTYPDKTMYPVASLNDKDFRNLMDVYLDAVFFPLIYTNDFTLRQEGWHYNLESLEGPLTYNGVVYNEMKGVYSSPDAFLERAALQTLFPDTTYGNESGGYPEAIPTLTKEEFLSFHKTYYSPENSYLYLYGNMDIEETLAYLDAEYLSKFQKTGLVASSIPLQAPLSRTAEVNITYPIGPDEATTGKTYHELSIVTGVTYDAKTALGLKLLETILLENQNSPLKRALIDQGLGQNISGSFETSILQPIFSIKATGSEAALKDKFLSTIYKTLQDLTIKGLDKEMLEGALNVMEFKLRESDFGSYPKGLLYGITIMENWLYGHNPCEKLKVSEAIAFLREGLKNNYFEQLIENYLLDNTHKVLVTMEPEPGKEEKEQQAAAEAMAALKATMSQQELEQHLADCNALHEFQATEDSEEARASIPILERSDIRRSIRHLDYEIESLGNNKLIYGPLHTNKIFYTDWYFNISDMTPRQTALSYLLVDILGKLDTKNYSYSEITTLSLKYLGGLSFDVQVFTNEQQLEDYDIYFTIRAKGLQQHYPQLFKLLEAILLESKFDDLNRFQELVAELKADWDNNFFSRGQSVAVERLLSYFDGASRVGELSMLSYYELLKDLTANFQAQGPQALAELKELLGQFCRNGAYTLCYSAMPEDREEVLKGCLDFAAKLPAVEAVRKSPHLPVAAYNEGIATAGKVQYVVAGGNFRDHGYTYTGAMKVLETILRYEYLWVKIRIQGGAYGATTLFHGTGLMALASYRDPQLEKSLEAYEELPAWLENLDLSQRELDKYVIGTMSGVDIPLTNSMILSRIATFVLRQVTPEKRQLTRDQVLDVSLEDLRALAPLIKDTLSDGYLCVVGGKQKLEASQGLFTKIINV